MYAWKWGNCGNICIFTGEDPTYRVIEMVNGTVTGSLRRDSQSCFQWGDKGVTRAAFSYGLERSGYVRIDTHEDNKPCRAL